MRRRAYEGRRRMGRPDLSRLPFRFQQGLLGVWEVITRGLSVAFAGGFRFLVAVQERVGRRIV